MALIDVLLSEMEVYGFDDTVFGRRLFISETIGYAVADNLSQNAAQRLYRSIGVSHSNNFFRTIYRDTLNIDLAADLINAIPADRTPADELFAQSRFELPMRYRYTIGYTGLDDEQNRVRKRWALDSTVPLSANEVLRLAEDASKDPNRESPQLGEDFEVIGGYIWE